MSIRIVLNGTTYRGLNELPQGFDARIQPFTNLPIWESLPDDVILDIKTINVTPKTWPTVQVKHLPQLPPSALSLPHDTAQNTLAARQQRAASALVELYLSHYNRTLQPMEAEELTALTGEAPERTAARLNDLFPTSTGRQRIDASGAPYTETFTNGNPNLKIDGTDLSLNIPQILRVKLRRSNEADPGDSPVDDSNRLVTIELRREVRYIANDSRDISIDGPTTARHTGWTDEVSPPPNQVKAFHDAVIGRRPLYTPTRLLTGDNLNQIFVTYAILAFVLVLIVMLIATLL